MSSFLEDYIAEIKSHQIQFVSLKFLDENNRLSQMDFNIDHLSTIEHYLPQAVKLIPIDGFIDPFRSRKTFSVFCYNFNVSTNYRKLLDEFFQDVNFSDTVFELSFFVDRIDNSQDQDNKQSLYLAVDPDDSLADLRADITNVLHEMGINIVYHYHGQAINECVVAISAKSAIALADEINILKYVILNTAVSYGYRAKFISQDNKAQIGLKNLPTINVGTIETKAEVISKYSIFNEKSVNKKINDNDFGKEIVLVASDLFNNSYLLVTCILVSYII